MSDPQHRTYRVSELSTARPTAFELRPGPAELEALKLDLGLDGLRKLSFAGEIAPEGARGWRLTGRLGATVVQPCVVTLAPVTTRIEEDVERHFVPGVPALDELPEEMEMPEDDTVEPLGDRIDPAAVMAEALSLALPPYPRAEGVEATAQVFSGPGVAPMTDDDVKPFAGLKALKDKLGGDD
ncbi:50S ribosomal protein L34 [Oceanicola sp. 22II-s10i]|uniref:YceD family protein n=1 Tax=Oceanicola sp. 22II-s10i TaxID=1317116 RepID=UPI000B529066|nr:DUF177 domain-containing protein [Oceanicola sp. 22II-s10i]OWU82338.1 50S ribosomal protein L34 [Oceanicola sp. 22II-s10i]